MSESPELRERRIQFERQAQTGSSLPSDVASLAAQRIGVAALVFSACYVGFDLLYHFTRINLVAQLESFFFVNTIMGLTSGLAMYWASRKWAAQPNFVIRLSLAFEILSSLLIGVAESAIPFNDNLLIRGQSAIAIWIGLFALLAPAPFRLALPAALASAAMAPFGLLLNIWFRGNPVPPIEIWLIWSTGPFLIAFVSTFLARWIFNLGTQLEQARDLGAYQLIETIGHGGMGEVWKAKHRFLARDAAVKLIKSNPDNSTVQRKRFEREAQVIARLECPHTVSIFDFGATPSGQLYFAMELIRGLNLDQLVTRFGPTSPARAVHIWTGVLRSLEEAHRAGLTHRDIKPSNILLARLGLDHDFVKVVDFGLVKSDSLSREQTQLTMETTTVGTPAYMAPELAEGDDSVIDGRADIYALGCVVYFLLTGRPVFEGSTPMALILKHISEAPLKPSERTELPIPEELEHLILWSLQKSPADRPQSAAELLRKLETLSIVTWSPADKQSWWKTHLPTLA
jgi:hypothetical protein